MRYIPVIGLEIHAEMLTASKVYCTCSSEFGGSENSRVCPRCAGLPGTLPLVNRGAFELAAKAGFALGCTVNEYSAFDRKNYFYPDLPKAYQITQFESPICTDGVVNVRGKNIRINRIHIEEDAGKLIHSESDGVSLADYNRCGVPLIEIVTEPDMRSGEEARDFVEEVALRLKYAGVCDCRMEQGSLRVDVNISVMPENSDEFGTRAEIKNLNSYRSIMRAIEYEIKRQSELLDGGGRVIQETRRFDDSTGITKSLRSKEEANDYRYFPEPDIPPVVLTREEIENIKNSMLEMPQMRLARYTGEYGLSEEDARLIISDKVLSDFYDAVIREYPNYRAVANMVIGEVLRNLKELSMRSEDIAFSHEDLAVAIKMGEDGIVSRNASKDIIRIMFEEGGKPEEIAQKHGLIMDNDTSAVEEIIRKVLSENPNAISDHRNGNNKIFSFLMGQVVRTAGKSANPKLIKELLTRVLEGEV